MTNSNQKIKENLEQMLKDTESNLSVIADKTPGEPGGWTSKHPKIKEDGPLDLESETDEVEMYVNNLPLEDQMETKIKNIKGAMDRLKKGKYGICIMCDKKINPKRLAILPETPTCSDCHE